MCNFDDLDMFEMMLKNWMTDEADQVDLIQPGLQCPFLTATLILILHSLLIPTSFHLIPLYTHPLPSHQHQHPSHS